MGPGLRRIGIRAAVAAASVVATLALVEAGLALFSPVEDLFLYEYRGGYVFNRPGFDNAHSPVPSHWARKLAREQGLFLPLKAHVRTNSRGERDDREPAYARGGAALRVLNLGDSMGFGWPVALEDTYLKVLERELPGTETVNCAVIGAPTAQLLPIYVRQCAKFEVDLVLLQITVDHVPLTPDFLAGDWLGPDFRLARTMRHVSAEKAPEFLERDILGVPRLKPEVLQREDAFLRRAFEPALPLYRGLHTVRFVENRWLRDVDAEMRATGLVAALLGPVGTTEYLQNPNAFIGPTLRNVLELRDLTTQRGAKLLVLLVPTSFRMRSLATTPRPDVLAFKDALALVGVPFVDAGDRIAPDRVDELFYKDDRHPTALGYHYIGKLLAETIRQAGTTGRAP